MFDTESESNSMLKIVPQAALYPEKTDRNCPFKLLLQEIEQPPRCVQVNQHASVFLDPLYVLNFWRISVRSEEHSPGQWYFLWILMHKTLCLGDPTRPR